MLLKTFKGGVYPSLNKNITAEKEFVNLSIPRVCYIPLRQHAGNPARPVVKVGDIVREGQMIGRADGLGSSNIHSSIPGKVIGIKDHPAPFSDNAKCVVIEAYGRFSSSGKDLESVSWQDINNEILIERISEAGIVDMGSGILPYPLRLFTEGKKIEYLIINASESEPYLTADGMLLSTFPEELIEGIRIITKILGVEKADVGIDNNNKKALNKLKDVIEKLSLKENIQLHPLKIKYPQGSKRLIIYSILKKKIPSGKFPVEEGVAVINIGTVFALREAVLFDKPLFERYVTVSGKIVNKPGNYKIRVGTTISDIIDECGGLSEHPAKIVMGGPMRGTVAGSLDIPVVKGTTGILFFSKKEVKYKKAVECIRCGRCVTACPMKLLPYDIVNKIISGDIFVFNPSDCIMCGSCSYVCPSGRPLTGLIKMYRKKLREKESGK